MLLKSTLGDVPDSRAKIWAASRYPCKKLRGYHLPVALPQGWGPNFIVALILDEARLAIGSHLSLCCSPQQALMLFLPSCITRNAVKGGPDRVLNPDTLTEAQKACILPARLESRVLTPQDGLGIMQRPTCKI